jgi:hypothetical protein
MVSVRQARGAAAVFAFLLVLTAPVLGQSLEPKAGDPPHLLEGDAPAAESSAGAGVKGWQVQPIAMADRPARILTAPSLAALGAVRIETANGDWYGIVDCESGLCAKAIEAPHTGETLPDGALPGSHMAVGRGRIARAWLAGPAQRLPVSAIGPWVAGSLIVEDKLTKTYQLDLGLDQAFEDLRPRILDNDDDRQGTVIVVRGSLDQGTSVVAVKLDGEGLLHITGESAPEARAGSWINPIGFGKFLGTEQDLLAVVRSPDRGGQLEILDASSSNFARRFAIPGVSNHIPGQPIQDLAVIADFDGDGVPDIAVPDSARKTIRILSFRDGKVAEPADIPLPSPVATEIAGIRAPDGGRPMLLMGLEDGELVLLH